MPFCSPDKITIPAGRFRNATTDDKDVIDLADSIKEIGQLSPVLVTKDMELVNGLHRLLAQKRLGQEVWWVDEKEGRLLLDNPLIKRVAEIQENVKRKGFTAAEYNFAIAEVDNLMREIYGSKKCGNPGIDGAGWTQQETAKKLGLKSRSQVSDAVTITKAFKEKTVPGIEKAETTVEMMKMVRNERKLEATKELAKRQSALNQDTEIGDPLKYFGGKIILSCALEGLKKTQNNVCNMFVTDPPWKIGADKKVEREGSTIQKSLGTYDDSSDDILPLLEKIIPEMYRVGKQNCWVVMFCGIKHWPWLTEKFRETGFQVYSKPLVWVRIDNDGAVFHSKSAVPTLWPASVTDFMILARKSEAVLYKLNAGDAFLHPIVPPAQRIHHSQKPLSLMEEIISRIYHPGTNPTLIDPFAGSGSTLRAARNLGIKNYWGYDISNEFRERAVAALVSDYVNEQKKVDDAVDLGDFEE